MPDGDTPQRCMMMRDDDCHLAVPQSCDEAYCCDALAADAIAFYISRLSRRSAVVGTQYIPQGVDYAILDIKYFRLPLAAGKLATQKMTRIGYRKQ